MQRNKRQGQWNKRFMNTISEDDRATLAAGREHRGAEDEGRARGRR